MTRELEQLREVHAVQGREGCWDIDDYMLGLYNGLELALSIMENRAPIYKKRNKWVGLTDEERSKIWGELPSTLNEERDACIFAECIEIYLKEKNS